MSNEQRVKKLVDRLGRLAQRLGDSKARQALLIKMGRLWQGSAVIMAPYKQGGLRDSLGYRLTSSKGQSVLEVGSYGIPYAAVHEFGIDKVVRVKSHSRTVSKIWGRRLQNPVVQEVRQHRRHMRMTAANKGKGYMRPALIMHRERFESMIRLYWEKERARV
jgi:hypothetical protein